MASFGDIPVYAALNDRLRTTSICLSVSYGARFDPPGGGGLAHMIEHVVMSTPCDGPPLSERVERLGGHANAETGLECMLFYAQVDAADADDISEALVRAVTAPEITQEILQSERQAVLQELAAARADPSDVVQDLFLARLFAGHPLGRPVAGTADEINALDLSTVSSGHAGSFLSSPMAIMVVGPRLPAVLAAAPPVTRVPGGRVPQALTPVVRQPPAWADEFSWMCAGARSPGLALPSWEYEVLAHLLGGSPSSLLYRKLRVEQGLAYMFQAWNRGYLESGAWRVLVGTEPANCDPVVDAIAESLEEVAGGGVGEPGIEAARRQARMQLILAMESPLEYARLLGYRWGNGHELVPDSFLPVFDEVTGDALARAARQVLDDLVVVATPERS